MKIKLHHTISICFVFFNHAKAQLQKKLEHTNRAFPLHYKEAYTSKKYVYEKQAPSVIDHLKEWLVNLIFKLFKNMGVPSEKLKHLPIIFYTLIAAISVYIIVKIVLKNEGQWIFKKKKHNNTLVYDTEVETIENANFNTLVRTAITNENYRLAVKYYYLWILQKLSEQQLIELNNLKTTTDYQLELESTKYATDFKPLAYYYNHIWYGEFTINSKTFETVKTKYVNLLNTISE